jgi:beta-lactamase class D
MRHPRIPLLLVLFFLFALCPNAGFAADIERPDLARLFAERNLDGCFVLKQGAQTIRVNPARAAQGYRPASTFKIVNALVALESGVAPDTDFLLRWDGVHRDFPGWDSDLTLEPAFRVSCVWYFVELGRLNGRERLGTAMRALDYGNADATGSDQFWLDGPLRISADGQVRYLDRLARGDVPFSARSLGLLRKVMLLEQGPDQKGDARGEWKLYGKSGMAVRGGVPGDPRDATPVGWLVGYVERGGESIPFALNLSPKPGDLRTWRDLLPERMELARAMLAACGVLPPK